MEKLNKKMNKEKNIIWNVSTPICKEENAVVKKAKENNIFARKLFENECQLCDFEECDAQATFLIEIFKVCEKHSEKVIKNFIKRNNKL